jgi:elongation factor Ts
MAEITAKQVKELRDQTGLPMMDCKKALTEAGGDMEVAIRNLRESGKKTMATRSDRSTEEGRISQYLSLEDSLGAMVEVQCESAPVASNEEFVQLGKDLAEQLATGPGAASPEELLSQNSPSKGIALSEQLEELQNRIREVFRVARILRIDGPCGGYVHHDGKSAVLLEVEGGNAEAAKDVSMHIAAMRPQVVSIEDLDPAEVQQEREILMEAARGEGKPDNIVEKMVEGRMRNQYYAQKVLLEQPFVKDDSQSVGKYAKAAGMKVVRYERWQLGGE